MGTYDDAMVKSLTTGLYSHCDDLLFKAKVHVKTYWKHDPKTGKLIQVHEHEAEHEGAHLMFNAGHKVRVTSGAHEGKELEIKGYDPDKKVFRTKHADNPNIAVSPHRIEHIDPEAGKPDWVKKKEADDKAEEKPSDEDMPSYKKGAVKAVADGQFVDYFDKDGNKVGTKKIGNAGQAKEQADSDNASFQSKQSGQAEDPADKEDKNSERDEKWKKELFGLAAKTEYIPENLTWNNNTVSDWEVLLDDKYIVQDLEQESLGDKSPLQLTYLTYAANKQGLHFLANKAYNKLKELAGVDDQEESGPTPSNKDEKSENHTTDKDYPPNPWEEEQQAAGNKQEEQGQETEKYIKKKYGQEDLDALNNMSPNEKLKFMKAYHKGLNKMDGIYNAMVDQSDHPFFSINDVKVQKPELKKLEDKINKYGMPGWGLSSLNGKPAFLLNSQLLDLSHPHYKQLKEIPQHNVTDISSFFDGWTSDNQDAVPIAVKKWNPFSEDISKNAYKKDLVVMDFGKDEPVAIQHAYYNYFKSKYPNATFKAKDPMDAMTVYDGDKIVGVVFPYTLKDAQGNGPSVKDIKKELRSK